jgi:hypothetical protein
MQQTVLYTPKETRSANTFAVALVLFITTAFIAGGAWFAQFGR